MCVRETERREGSKMGGVGVGGLNLKERNREMKFGICKR